MQEILIIYTGGTIGMQASEIGLVPAAGLPDDLQAGLQAKGLASQYDLRVEVMQPLLDSADIGPNDWFQIADVARKHLGNATRVVILHGTDSLAYTGSALSYLLLGLKRPVVLTGSQQPMGVAGSDALDNFIGALSCDLPAGLQNGVSLYFAGRVLAANRSIKWDAEGLDGFRAPCAPSSDGLMADFKLKGGQDKIKQPIILVQRIVPGELWFSLQAWCNDPPQALLISVYGAGTLPRISPDVATGLSKLAASGCLIVAISQCAKGRLQFDRYAAGALLNELGAINGEDMTLEAAYGKLQVLFSLGYSASEVSDLMRQNLAGEISLG